VALTAYETQTQRLLHDKNATYYPISDIDAYINIARRQIALESQCVRALLSGGTITGLTLVSPGSGYTNPILTFTGGGFQAFGTITQSGGILQTPTLTRNGWGFVSGATVTVTGGAGTGGSVTATVDQSLTTVPNQEVYNFSTANTLAQTIAGVQSIVGVTSVAVSWGSMKPVLEPRIFTEFQAYYRSYNTGLQNFPTLWSQYGQGTGGSIYLWPIPSTASQMDWDCWMLPIDLVNDSTAEAILSPWTDCVPYYAAYLAYDNSQRKMDSDRMFQDYERFMKRARAFSESTFVPEYYPRD
jgi:hypothetical protein